jgi:hypothetical protein
MLPEGVRVRVRFLATPNFCWHNRHINISIAPANSELCKMNQLDKHQQKTWNSGFVIDGAKLTRLHEVVDDRLSEDGKSVTFEYVVSTARNKLSKRSNLDDVLKLDNTRKDPIRAFSMTADGAGAKGVDIRATVEFTPPRLRRYDSAQRNNIRLTVAGTDNNLVNEVFASLYEQIERTLISPWAQITALAIALGLFVFTVAAFLEPQVSLGSSHLSSRDLEALTPLAKNAHDTDSRVNFLFEVRRHELDSMIRLHQGIGLRGASLIITIIIIVVAVALLLYLGAFCYPGAVFAWGDYGEYYGALVARRKAIWKWLGVSLMGGILLTLFGTSIQRSVFP